MATRSTIVIEIPASKNGKTYQFKTPHYEYETPAVTIPENARYAVIYCHWDGYPDGLGADLAEIENGKYYYGDFDTVMNLIIAGGDSSYLGQPYHAWRNEEWESVQPRFTETLPPVTEEYQYLFTEEGNWEYRSYKDTNFTCLTNKGTLSSTPKKIYTVNVHYDAVATVEVEAESEEEALELAQNEASEVEIEDYFYKDACVTNVEEL